MWRFCLRAPKTARLFLCVLFLAFSAAVLLPDLVQGGRRSLHPRYVLPALLALELAVAYVFAAGWDATSERGRAAARFGLLLVLGTGLWSGWLILQADTWWNKVFSAENRDVAALVNAAQRPLVVVSESPVGLGEVISLSYGLDARVILRGEPRGGDLPAVDGFSDVFLLTPSERLRAALEGSYDLEPLLDTWQWTRAVPRPKGGGA